MGYGTRLAIADDTTVNFDHGHDLGAGAREKAFVGGIEVIACPGHTLVWRCPIPPPTATRSGA